MECETDPSGDARIRSISRKEQYSRAFWFAEGVTNTYGVVHDGAHGTVDASSSFTTISASRSANWNRRPANRWQSAEQSSLDAWLEKYPLYNRADDSISYYTKGQVLGVLLDILIRDRTANDEQSRRCDAGHERRVRAGGKSYRDSCDVQLTAEKLAGGSFEEFFNRYVAGAEPLPYRATLQLAGLDLRRECAFARAAGNRY